MRLSRRAYVLLVLVGVSASLSVVVYATVTQIFPAVIVPSLTFSTHQNCSTLNVQNAPAAGVVTMIADCLLRTSHVDVFSVDRDGRAAPPFSVTHDTRIPSPALGTAPDGPGVGAPV